MPFAGQVPAVRAGDLLFLSNLMAVNPGGSVAAGKDAGSQIDHILAAAERICAKAGTSLANVVRAQQFHTNLADFAASWPAWRRHLGDRPLPYSAVEVPALAVPGATVMLDLWVYVP
jgi:enamine deaminase RidA (YjgF/YER057c/UK114 family)